MLVFGFVLLSGSLFPICSALNLYLLLQLCLAADCLFVLIASFSFVCIVVWSCFSHITGNVYSMNSGNAIIRFCDRKGQENLDESK